MEKLDRREFLKKAALTPMALASGKANAGSNSSGDTLAVLNAFDFADQDGKQVSANALLQKLKGKPVTVSFAYVGCSQKHKQMHQALAGLENVAPDIAHVVIDTDLGFVKGASQQLMSELRNTGMSENIVILYPRSEDLDKIQESIGLVAIADPNSIVSIVLYGRDGKRIGNKSTEQNSPQKIIAEWQGSLGAGRVR